MYSRLGNFSWGKTVVILLQQQKLNHSNIIVDEQIDNYRVIQYIYIRVQQFNLYKFSSGGHNDKNKTKRKFNRQNISAPKIS